MEVGVLGGTMVVAVNLVVEVLNAGPGRVMEETLALDHQPNQLHAIRTVVHVRRCTIRI